MRARAASAVASATLLVAAAAAAQAPPARPAAPETLRVELRGPAGAPAPRLSVARPETLRTGDPFELELAFPGGATVPPDSIAAESPWVDLASASAAAPEGPTRLTARVLRPGPVRFVWAGAADGASPVVVVAGRLGPDAGPAPVRDPWRPRRRLLALGALVALALLAALLATWWWRRRRGRKLVWLTSRPSPPWAVFALTASTVLDEGCPGGEDGRRSLATLAGAVRVFLADRYGVPATSLAPDELEAALARRQYPADAALPLIATLRDLDRRRYAPHAPSSGEVRALLRAATAGVAECRDPATADPALAVDAAAAWRRLDDAAGEVARA